MEKNASSRRAVEGREGKRKKASVREVVQYFLTVRKKKFIGGT